MATEQLRPVMCATCSAPTGEMRTRADVDAQGRFGTCQGCAVAADVRPWTHRDADDNFVPEDAAGARHYDYDEDDEEPEDERPRCQGCGDMEFVARAEVTSSWYGRAAEYDTSTAYFDLTDALRWGNSDITVECCNCGRDVTGEISWEND